MRSPILYFFLLVLGVSFDFTPDIINKRDKFSKTLSEECLEFVPSEGSDSVLLNLSFVLLPAEVDFISEKQGRERDALVARGTGRIEIIFTLLAEVITLHM